MTIQEAVLILDPDILRARLRENAEYLLGSSYNFGIMPGFAAGIQLNGAIIDEYYCGTASIEHSIPINVNTRFHVASLSKQITAVLLALAEGRGEVSLSAPATNYIDYPIGDKIRVIDLVKHTSGLRDQWELLDWAGWRGSDLITSADVAHILKRQTYPPRRNSSYRYCNTGYFLLAELLERRLGASLAELANRELFGPLSMTVTEFRSDPSKPIPNYASSYLVDDQAVSVSTPNLAVPGPTSLITSLRDFMRWEAELSVPHLLSPNLVARLSDRDEELVGFKVPYGWGFMLVESELGALMFHTGQDLGASAVHIRHLKSGLTCIMMANSSSIPLWNLAFGLIAFAVGAPSQPIYQPMEEKQALDTSTPKIVGEVFHSDAGDVMYVVHDGDDLQLKGFVNLCLSRESEDRFASKAGKISITFQGPRQDGTLLYSTLVESIMFKKLPSRPRPDSTTAAGRFYSPALSTSAEIEACNGGVKIALSKGREWQSAIFDGHTAIFDEFWCLSQDEGWKTFTLNSARAKDVEFIRLD